ncbi:phosphotransferase family protein [Dethiothermospora halolimnae]|uniref:phosphotransferase family protein n=1 Tax=Dethiothermospora halolimnae TaxID=3114390 RepID=UPI003CCC27A5
MENNMSVTTVRVEDKNLLSTLKEVVQSIFTEASKIDITAFKETNPEEERVYDVYKVNVDGSIYVLKRTDKSEVEVFKKYLNNNNFPVPAYYTDYKYKENFWIIEEFVSGIDLKLFNKETAVLCADSLATISNYYWSEKPNGIHEGSRMDKYLKRILKRKECLKNRPDELKAYEIFINRQRTCPRTLSHGDLLPLNAIKTEKEVVFIDWGFSGIMPYSIDPARLITHGSETDNIYYMTEELKKIFLESYYENLTETGLSYEEYLWDIQLSCLNESIEFIEKSLKDPDGARENEFFQFYDRKLRKISKGILEGEIVII